MRWGHFEIFRAKDKSWRFRLRAGNGKVVCQSEGYTTRRRAVSGVHAVRRIAGGSIVIDRP